MSSTTFMASLALGFGIGGLISNIIDGHRIDDNEEKRLVIEKKLARFDQCLSNHLMMAQGEYEIRASLETCLTVMRDVSVP